LGNHGANSISYTPYQGLQHFSPEQVGAIGSGHRS
jgi:hypothetical protein